MTEWHVDETTVARYARGKVPLSFTAHGAQNPQEALGTQWEAVYSNHLEICHRKHWLFSATAGFGCWGGFGGASHFEFWAESPSEQILSASGSQHLRDCVGWVRGASFREMGAEMLGK